MYLGSLSAFSVIPLGVFRKIQLIESPSYTSNELRIKKADSP